MPARTGRRRPRRERLLPLRLVLVLGSLTAVGSLSLTLYLPALPQLAADLWRGSSRCSCS